MATISTRQRKDGSLAYLTEVRVKRDGEIVHRESRTFDRRAQAKAWAESREKKFARESPTAKRPQRVTQTTLRHVLRRYREEVSEVRPMGRSKMWFAIHSARRQSEITDLLFSDNDEESQTGAVRDLKHPTERDQIRRFKYTPKA